MPPPVASRYYYLKDHLGSIRTIVNGAGTVDSYKDYYPFGMVMEGRSGTGTADKRFEFTGYEKNTQTGSLHAGQREYLPLEGKFNRVDRFDFKYPGQSPYSYAANNPPLFVDSNGDSVKWYFAFASEREKFEQLRRSKKDIAYMLGRLEAAEEWYTVSVDFDAMGRIGYDELYQAKGNKEIRSTGGTLWLRLADDPSSARHGIFHAYQHFSLGDEGFAKLSQLTSVEAEPYILNAWAGDQEGITRSIANAAARWISAAKQGSNLREEWRELHNSIKNIQVYKHLGIPRHNVLPMYLMEVMNKIKAR